MRLLATLLGLPLVLLPSVAVAQTLDIQVTRPADCTRKTQNGDTVSMMYKGTLQSDGSKFDSSYDRGRPFKFTLGKGQVITGWDEGLLDMCIGEARKLTIPPNMGYGNSGNGVIPPGSTLIFETELMGIDGVKAEPKPVPASTPAPARPSVAQPDQTHDVDEAPPDIPTYVPTYVPTSVPNPVPTPVATHVATLTSSPAILELATPAAPATEPTKSAIAQGNPLDNEESNGECNLLGDFALIVQGALGLLAVSSLAVKRLRESPRRPLKIWFFDVSKQVFGSVLLHLANILMSMLSSGKFDVATNSTTTPQYPGTDDQGDKPNPCSFYLLNLAIDTTIGIPILVLLLKVLHRAFALTPLANPPESIRSGNYGQPPRATWWLKQSIIYFLGLIGMKLCVLAIFAFLPWIAWVGDWALRWTEGNAAVQIAFVMFIFPLIMNALQYWIIDNFIKDPGHGDGEGRYAVAAGEDSDDETDDEWLERQRRRREAGVDGDGDSDIEAAATEPLKEANPTAIPVRTNSVKDGEYDPATDGAENSRASKARKE
ncbi:FK506-binding protein-like protein 2 precursor [Cucurbitaria berberidis CBS 394.84]|uniref:peptidylprolyl isomerase n=1 Tax=Cucurbitaria berberidis CBS 394.84 TaxID=1168544 RepID=A0A9P4LBW8_9PLEO|nr:FK506-binding protein-like protein 2 precursor [Cucurbitaria berberidis CBS 394.84]KAF1848569.1 FK506-binding protein-like protein 2 precursor [Cucurbitaria berberidis CBS 394.84]